MKKDIRRGKTKENDVSKYLFGTYRDWKERHDISGKDKDGDLWVGEVKAHKVSGLRTIYRKLNEALDQCITAIDEGLDTPANPFSVLCPPHTMVKDALVMFIFHNQRVIVTLEQFRALLFG